MHGECKYKDYLHPLSTHIISQLNVTIIFEYEETNPH